MQRRTQAWMLPVLAVAIYPGVLLAFDGAINGYRQSGSAFMAAGAVVTMLLAMCIPLLAARALLMMRNDAGPLLARAMLFLIFAAPSLFTQAVRSIRMAGLKQPYEVFGVWAAAWLVIGVLLYVRNGGGVPKTPRRPIKWLRIVHGATALTLLCGFLLAHLANHGLAAWSAELHGAAMDWLRGWYRSEWVEPALLALLAVMIATGVPMVLHYSRQRMDAFRVIQAATGVYVGVFICSHLTAIFIGRDAGVETDWFFAAGPDSLLAGTTLLGRLIPHYVFGTLCLIVHVACGLRVVLLQHGVAQVLANRALFGLAGAGTVVTAVIAAALLGFHVNVN
jgi:hypothetical protein